MTDPVKTQWDADAILKFLHDHRDELRAMGVQKIGLFGSYVRGEQNPDSYIDFLLKMESWTWKRWCRVWDFLEDHLGVSVDLVPEKDLRKEIRPKVMREVRYVTE